MIEKPNAAETSFTGADKRRAPRFRALLTASIVGRDKVPLNCTVNQLSATGARLSIATTIALPEEFEIAIPQKNIACHARLVWRKGDQAGIDFAAGQLERGEPARPDRETETGSGWRSRDSRRRINDCVRRSTGLSKAIDVGEGPAPRVVMPKKRLASPATQDIVSHLRSSSRRSGSIFGSQEG
jgi:PilZ domain